jgi:hypothetical protein
MLSEHDQGVYLGMISAACLLYERHGPFWRPSKYRTAYREIMAEAQALLKRALARARDKAATEGGAGGER